METNILKQIFFDEHNHWDNFVKKHGNKIRPAVIKEVKKFRGCGDPRNGFKIFVCEGCHAVKRVPYRCKGRFCNTCSNGETEEWSRLLADDVVKVVHRHAVFTMDEGLWPIFLKHRSMLKELMDEAVGLVQNWFKKKLKVTPGVIAGLHTFGSRMNFNPHVHMLVTMGGMKKNGEWKTYNFIPFEMLRKQWQTVVLKLIRKTLTEQEKRKVQPLLQKAYKNNPDGFYIHAPKQRGNVKEQLGYIGRYIRRPAIALHRIEEYDGQYVTFKYVDKTDGKEKRETISVEEFISRLIRHIPDENFKTIRYYGIYSRRIKTISKKMISIAAEETRKWIVKIKRSVTRRSWRKRIHEQTGKDPMICTACENYYEYKGEVCLHEGKLAIKYAKCDLTRKCLERMISDLTGIETSQKETKKEEKSKPIKQEIPEHSQLSLFAV
jgi:hypothetical protein